VRYPGLRDIEFSLRARGTYDQKVTQRPLRQEIR
jgi:hypothetical protein